MAFRGDDIYGAPRHLGVPFDRFLFVYCCVGRRAQRPPQPDENGAGRDTVGLFTTVSTLPIRRLVSPPSWGLVNRSPPVRDSLQVPQLLGP